MRARTRSSRKLPILISLALLCGLTVVNGKPVDAAFSIVADYEMNEGPGATVMVDSGPSGLSGTIGDEIVTGAEFAGSVGYRWRFTPPNRPPAKPGRIASVASSPSLNPGTDDYAVEFRYRTTQNFGNVLQKGQNKTPGGYFKFEQPNGRMTCLFKGENGRQRAVRSPIETNDGEWHVIRCERTDWGVRLYVDGALVKQLRGQTGRIANDRQLSIGGKSVCDQGEVTCDYFTGSIDYIRIESSGSTQPPANQPPQPRFTSSCDDTICDFDARSSADPDGQIVGSDWDFGDGSTGTGLITSHTYAIAATYTATLTVVDDDGASAQISHVVNAGSAASPITHVDSNTRVGWSRAPGVQIPTVQSGDTILLFVTAASNVSVDEPAGGGWQPVDTAAGANGVTRVWQTTAASTDSGDTVTVTFSTGAKYVASTVVYRGVAAVAAVEHDVNSSSTASRVTPIVNAADPASWGVSFWMHRDSSTTALNPPPGVAARVAASRSGGGHATVLIADSDGSVSGAYGGLTATAQVSSTFGITITIILSPL